MIRLGLRLTVSGGREAITRLIIVATAVGIGVGLLLTAVAAVNAVNAQNASYAWLDTTPATRSAAPARDPLWGNITTDRFGGQTIYRADVAATGPASVVPPGIPRDPGPGQYYASPALSALLRSIPADQLADRYPGHETGTIGNAGLPSPASLIIIIGRSPAEMASMPGAAKVTSLNTTPPSSCGGNGCVNRAEDVNAQGVDLILSVVAVALLLPVLIFIATATRLSAARREQRFAAMRLTGATPRQISLIAAVESVTAATTGVAAGFGLFFLLRIPLAAIPFTGVPFFPAQLSLSLPDTLAVAIGVPVAAAAVARLALHRVNISPLGVARRVTPPPPRAWRVLPLLAGLAELGFFAWHGRPDSTTGQISAFLPGFALIMIGLVTAGPWLTMTGARMMARRASRPGALIAARRLADDPRAGFRAVSGLVLALFITTVAVALIATQNAKRTGPVDGTSASNILVDQFTFGPAIGHVPAGSFSVSRHVLGDVPAPPAAVLTRLGRIGGVQAIIEFHADPGLSMSDPQLGLPPGFPAAAVSCTQLASVPALGHCAAGAAAAEVPAFITPAHFAGRSLARVTWPAVSIPPQRLQSLPLYSLNVDTSGSAQAVEQARTVLENAYPAGVGSPETLGEDTAAQNIISSAYQQLAEVVILASLAVAGCTLAASVTAGLADRKRPFSLLRLTGARLRMLGRVVALESAAPLLTVAVVAIGTGFGAAAMFSPVQMQHSLVAPPGSYYVITAAGIVVALGVILATFPLLQRITGAETARNE